MKKKVIIVMTSMYLGGAERSLLGLLEAFDYERYSVSLFLLDHSGELMEYIPREVHLLPENPKYKALEGSIKDAFRNRQFSVGFRRILGKIKSNQFAKRFLGAKDIIVHTEYKQKYTWEILPMISDDTYDLAISFMTPHYVTAYKVNAKKKIAWVHTDYTKMHLDIDSELKMWDLYTNIAAVSEGVRDCFVEVFPSLKNKMVVIENVLPETMIRKQAQESLDDEMKSDAFILLSIGRFTNAKNFDQVPDICRRIMEKGLKVVWYLIGFGGEEELIKEKIEENKMQDNVILLGKKDNPYPYIRACDLYVQPSRYEGKSVTVREAQMLGKPVVITNYATAASQLNDGRDGMIVPMDNEGCAREITELLLDSNKMKELSDNTSERDYSNKEEINKLYKLI